MDPCIPGDDSRKSFHLAEEKNALKCFLFSFPNSCSRPLGFERLGNMHCYNNNQKFKCGTMWQFIETQTLKLFQSFLILVNNCAYHKYNNKTVF